MSLFIEQSLKNSEVCERLKISDYKRKQYVARGILDAPIDLGGVYPQHTLSQVVRAEYRIKAAAEPTFLRAEAHVRKKTKPLSMKLVRRIRGAIFR